MTDVPVLAAAFCIHAVPAYGGISSTIIPCTIVTGLIIDYHQHCSLEVGKYVQAHKKSGNTNPVGNHQDSWRFMSLTTVNEIIRCKQNTLLMPNEVIDRVHTLAWHDQCGIAFSNRNRQPFEDDDKSKDGKSYDTKSDANRDDDDDNNRGRDDYATDSSDAGSDSDYGSTNDTNDDDSTGVYHPPPPNTGDEELPIVEPHPAEHPHVRNAGVDAGVDTDAPKIKGVYKGVDLAGVDADRDPNIIEEQPETVPSAPAPRRDGLRPCHTRTYTH